MPQDRPCVATKREPTPDTTDPAGSLNWPYQLQRTVPYCARRCLASYITQQYNCHQNDFACLCLQYSSRGFSLGELGILCIERGCAEVPERWRVDLYAVCGSMARAVEPTHKTLTALPTTDRISGSSTTEQAGPTTRASEVNTTRASEATTTRASEATTMGTSEVTTTFQTHSKSSQSTPTISTSIPESEVVGSTASTPDSPTSGAASGNLDSSSLTGGEAAGISIGAVGAIILAVAAIFLCIRIRRKRQMKRVDARKSYDFVDEAPARSSSFNYETPFAGYDDRRAELRTQQIRPPPRWPLVRMVNESPEQREESDGSDITYQRRRASVRSMRTLSQLLPEKPASTLIRPPVNSPALSNHTVRTVFEEDRSSVPGRKPRPDCLRPGMAMHYPPPPPQRVQPQDVSGFNTTSSDQRRHPSLSLEIPRQAARAAQASSPMRHANEEVTTRDSTGSVLDYYSSPEAEAGYLAPHTEDEGQKRKPMPNIIRPRPRRQSAGSDTSFESMFTDDGTPPEEPDRRLTPVPESPIACIRYPKVPRSSNQVVARSPGARTPADEQNPMTPEQRKGTTSTALTGSTLAAKRIGDSAAQRLLFTTSHPSKCNTRQESPLKGYGRVKGPRPPPDNICRPPPSTTTASWEPKLTPTRRGEDLYLSVGVATPTMGQFR